MALRPREVEKLALAIERWQLRTGRSVPDDELSVRDENILLEELGFDKRPDTDPPRNVKDVSDDILSEFERRRGP